LFGVTPDQLRARAGQVRCGQCSAVFDGLANLVPESGREPAPAEQTTPGTADATPTEMESLDFADPAWRASAGDAGKINEAEEPEPVSGEAPVADARPADAADAAPSFPEAEAAEPEAEEAEPQRWLRREWRTVAVSALLALLLAAQIGIHRRDVLAAEHPGLRGVLAGLCGIVGCEVRLPRAVDRLSIEGDEMVAADPKEPSRIALVATLRNSAPFPVAFPSLELSLQNAGEEVLARRVIGPADYTQAESDLTRGIPARGELNLRLSLDTGSMRAEGYRLLLFYPNVNGP
jgi:predicted Zn finger-like uncharacterized protein